MNPLLDAADYQSITGQTVQPVALSMASGLVRSYCGWTLSQETDTITLDSDGGIVLTLPSLLVTAVTSVMLNGTDPNGDPFPAIVEGTDWDWRTNGVLMWISPLCPWPGMAYGWPFGGQRVTVGYTSGYAVIPDEIQAVVASVAERIGVSSAYHQQLDNVGGVSQNVTYTTAAGSGSGLTPIEKLSLDRYRLVNIA